MNLVSFIAHLELKNSQLYMFSLAGKLRMSAIINTFKKKTANSQTV